jgi:hypothetical protein
VPSRAPVFVTVNDTPSESPARIDGDETASAE